MKKKLKAGCGFLAVLSLMLQGCGSSGDGKDILYETINSSEHLQETEKVILDNKDDLPGNNITTEQGTTVDLQQLMIERTEERIKEMYLDKLVLEEAVRTLIAERLNSTHFVTVDAKEKYDIKEVLIDEISGNPIVSEGVKSMLSAVSEKKPISEIVDQTIQGAAGGVSDYLTGELEGVITDALGVDIFSAVDFINSWNNADSTPTVLLQNIVNDQKTDVAKLDAFLQHEKMNAADILKVSQLVYCIHVREQEISAITGEKVTDSNEDFVQLEKIAGQYAGLEEQIGIYATFRFSDNITDLSKEEKSIILEKQGELSDILSEAQQLNELSVGHIAVNYDVEGFVTAQESTSQSGLIGNAFLGNVLGQAAAEDMQVVEDQVQEKRATLYNRLSDYIEESFQMVAQAKTDYDGKVIVMQWASQAQEDELYWVDGYLMDTNWKADYENAKKNYVAALEKYQFDLACAYQFYECILSSKQADFLAELEKEKNQIEECVNMWDSEKLDGYTKEEKNERYGNIIALYVDSVDYIQIRGASLGQTPGFHSGSQITKYGDGVYCSYINDDKITLIIRLRNNEYIYGGGGVRSYYDMQGNPIYCCAGQDWISLFNNEVMAYELMNDDFISQYEETARNSMKIFSNN